MLKLLFVLQGAKMKRRITITSKASLLDAIIELVVRRMLVKSITTAKGDKNV